VYLAPFPTPADRHGVAALPGALIGAGLAQLEGRAPELGAVPVRAVWGLADPLVGAGELERWRALIPGLPVDTVERAGHFVADEAPDVVAAAVRSVEEDACHRSPPLAC
jgi:pimeloyl-ACP methyl ester carboxylesterase